MLNLAFYIMAITAIGGGGFMLYTRNVMHAMLALLLVLLAVAGLFILLSADFVGVTQVIIYAAGILVLLVFGIMLTNRGEENGMFTQKYNSVGANTALVLLACLLCVSLFYANFNALYPGKVNGASLLERVGVQTITAYSLPFEVVALLLLGTVIGAAIMAFPRAKKSG